MTDGPKSFPLAYLRGLDGVRGLAILMVMLDHGKIIGDGFGFLGVNTFFVLSGFLITSLLVTEWEQKGAINLVHFYFRRALRLLPALCVLLVVFLILAFLLDPHRRALREVNEALFALFYFTNWAAIFHLGRHITLLHTWSLSVEEQFYLLWPLILMFFLRKTTRPSLLCWICLGIFLSGLARVAVMLVSSIDISYSPFRLNFGLDTRADSLLAGCFAGMAVTSNLLRVWNRPKALSVAAAISLTGLLFMGTLDLMTEPMILFGWPLASLFAAVLIVHLTKTSGSVLHFIFENRVMVFIGRISYGLYLWHYVLLTVLQQQDLPWRYGTYLVPVFAVAILSYYVVERPCLRIKHRFQEVR